MPFVLHYSKEALI